MTPAAFLEIDYRVQLPKMLSAILPILACAAQRRFDPTINDAWQVCMRRLLIQWRNLIVEDDESLDALHHLAWQTYRLLLKTGDPYCLPFAEALVNAVGRYESVATLPESFPLKAALCSTFEVLSDTDLEHPDLNARLTYFTKRLTQSAESLDYDGRSEIIDRLFLSEAIEQLELIHHALNELPPNVETLQLSADWLVQEAMQIELNDVARAARQLEKAIGILARDPSNEKARVNVFATMPNVLEKIREISN